MQVLFIKHCVIRTLYASVHLIFAKKPYIYTYFVCKKNGTQKG